MPLARTSSILSDVVALKSYYIADIGRNERKSVIMSEKSFTDFMEEVKNEIKLAPKMFRQLQKRDELIKTLKQQRDDSLKVCKELVNFCESKERLNQDDVCPSKAYELAKAAIATPHPSQVPGRAINFL